MISIRLYTVYKRDMSENNDDNIENLTHVLKIPRSNAVALCEAKPSGKSSGWISDSSKIVTCPKCLEKLSTTRKKIELIYDNSIK